MIIDILFLFYELQKKNLFEYLGKEITADEISGELIRQAMNSKARNAILSMQDILGLDGDARLNFPGTKESNWQWRMPESSLTPELTERLALLVSESGRRG